MSAQPPQFPDDDRGPIYLFRRVPFSKGRAIRGFLHNLDFLESELHSKGYTRLADSPNWGNYRRWQHRRKPDRRVYIEIGTWESIGEWRSDMFIAHSLGAAAWWVRLLPDEVLK